MATQAVRHGAIRDMFVEVERRWGDLGKLMDSSLRVERGALSRGALERLFGHETLALVVPGFVARPEPLAQALVAASASASARNWSVSSSRGLESSDVQAVGGTPRGGRVGTVRFFVRVRPATAGEFVRYNMAVASGATEAYFESDVASASAFLRRACSGDGTDASGGSVLDRLRSELDDHWAHGCSAHRDDRGRPHHAGLGRVMAGPTRFEEGFVHVDELAAVSRSRGSFSANVYLRQPSEGGHLELWPLAFRSRWEFYANAHTLSKLTSIDEGAQASLRAALPPPVVVPVDAGDLVLLCVQRPHAVQGWATTEARASLQSFLNFRGPAAPLTLEA